MKKSEFAEWLDANPSECCPPGGKAYSCPHELDDSFSCAKCWTEFLATLEDDEPHVCKWKLREDFDHWSTTCGKQWDGISISPDAFDRCPFCGLTLELYTPVGGKSR